MSLPLLHAGRTNPGLSAALDLRFALDKSLTAYRGPTPSFSRASTGSYFDGSGVLRYAALNIFPYSEDINLNFSKDGCTVSSNVTASPDGKLTADKLVEGSGVTAATLYTITSAGKILSIYAKKSERDFLFLGIDGAGGCYFNLNSGAVGSAQAGSNGQIESVGNGWYRCSLKTNLAGGIPFAACSPTDSGSGIRPSYTGNGSSGIFLWGAMFENSGYLSPYAATNGSSNAGPRFDHTFNGTSWVSRGLLAEEQRTNSSPYSVTFNSGNAPWGMADLSISLNSATAPDGTNTATKLIDNVVNSNHNIFRQISFSGTITFSVFAKAAGRNYVQIFIGNLGSPEAGINVDLTNGTITNQSPSVVASGTQDVGNGWYRIWFSATGAGGIYYPAIATSNAATGIRGVYTGNGTSGVYIWGAQWESGSFPTSYIENSGNGSTTRSADVCQITGADFSGFWNGTEGSFAVEFDRIGVDNAKDSEVFQVTNSSGTNQFYLDGQSGNEFFLYYTGTTVANLALGPVQSAGTSVKASTAYKVNDFAGSRNGGAVVTDSSGTVPVVDRLSLGRDTILGLFYFNGHIARLRYYRKRLPNETLQLLSEPDPTLNLQFALNKSLTPVAGPAPSFSRASTGTYFNASGVLTSASINTPRFDHVYSGGQWVSRGLLVEEQRTNLLQNSENFSLWSLSNTSRSTSGTTPQGTSATLVTGTGSSGWKAIYNISAGTVTGQASYSACVKAGTHSIIQIALTGSETGGWVNYDLTNQTYSIQGTGTTTASVRDLANGWLLISMVRTIVSSSNGIQITLVDSLSSARSASTASTGNFAIAFCQIESGSFPTSYIPTTSSSVTRSADVCQITGTSFGSMWNQGEGSFAFEADGLNPNSVASAQTVYSFDDGSSANSIYGLRSGNTAGSDYLVLSYTSGVEKVNFSNPAGTWLVNVPFKNAIGFKLNDFAQSNNGGSVVTDTNCTMPIGVNQLSIGRLSYAGFPINGHIAKLIYYPARLANTKLQQLST